MNRHLHPTAALLLVAALAAAPGCGGDPKDPETWIKALEDTAKRSDAIDQLTRMVTDTKDEAARTELEKRITEAMVKAYEVDVARDDIVKALARWKHEEAGPVFVSALSEWKEGITDERAIAAAVAAGEMKLKDAVPPLIACLKADSMRLRLEAARSLGNIGTPAVVEPLIASMLHDADTQDFFINRIAAEKLGQVGDPRAARPLLRGMFRVGRGADLFPFAAPSLVRLGPKVVNPLLIEMIDAKNIEVNDDAKTFAFNQVRINSKAYEVMGLFYEADDETRAFLMKSLETDTDDAHRRMFASEALGRVGGAGVKDTLLKWLADAKTTVPTKVQVLKGLKELADPSTLPTLVAYAGPKGVVKDLYGNPADNLRFEAFEAVTLMGTKADVEKAEADTADLRKKIGEMKKEAEGMEADNPAKGGLGKAAAEFEALLGGGACAKECDKDAACYAGKLKDADETVARAAAWHLATMGAKEHVKALVDAVDTEKGKARLGILYAINRLHGEGAAAEKIWAAILHDAADKRKFASEQVYRDSMITYWNVRRWTAK